MNWIIENWYVIVGLASIVGFLIYIIMKFLGLPTSQQIAKVKEWLLYAVSVAEAELGGGTGPLKLRYVYDMFVEKFPSIAKLISFETFSKLVDEALEQMRNLLETNVAVNKLILGENKK